jgi:hypothetical protein
MLGLMAMQWACKVGNLESFEKNVIKNLVEGWLLFVLMTFHIELCKVNFKY